MNGQTHKLGGLCTGIVTSSLLVQDLSSSKQILLAGILISGSLIGSLIPDIDHRQSQIGKKMKITSFIVNKLCGHRKLTHAPLLYIVLFTIFLFPAILSGNFNTLYFNFILGILLGIASHLFLDSLTVSGIPLLYPFKKEKYHLLKYSTNRKEYLPKILILLSTVAFLYIRIGYFI